MRAVPLLDDLHAAVVARLKADEHLAEAPAIPVIRGDQADVEQRIAELIGPSGACGLVIVVNPPEMLPARVPEFREITILVGIVEDGVLNLSAGGTGRTGAAVRQTVDAALSRWQPALDGVEIATSRLRHSAASRPSQTEHLLTFNATALIHSS